MGIQLTRINLTDSVSQFQLLDAVKTLNQDPHIHGILVQLPLPPHIVEMDITESIDPFKDVDGFHSSNMGKLTKKETEPLFVPCTPKGVIELIKATGIEICGKRAVVVGRSNIVGMPVFNLLNALNATVTLCHSKTRDLPEILASADIVVAAIGCPEFIKAAWIKPGAIVIDVGTNPIKGKW